VEVPERFFSGTRRSASGLLARGERSAAAELRTIEEGWALTWNDLGYCGAPNAEAATGAPSDQADRCAGAERLVVWVKECVDLSKSASAFMQTALDECGGAIGR
jgi:hypothetical protein